MATKRKTPPKRADENVAMSISLPKELRDAIKNAAAEDRRSVSNYIVKEMERILASLKKTED